MREELIVPVQQSSNPRILVAIGIKKAFDTVLHSVIKKTMQQHGIRCKILAFWSFLSRRSYRVKVGMKPEPPSPDTIGVPPQESVISPALFNLIFNAPCH